MGSVPYYSCDDVIIDEKENVSQAAGSLNPPSTPGEAVTRSPSAGELQHSSLSLDRSTWMPRGTPRGTSRGIRPPFPLLSRSLARSPRASPASRWGIPDQLLTSRGAAAATQLPQARLRHTLEVGQQIGGGHSRGREPLLGVLNDSFMVDNSHFHGVHTQTVTCRQP